MFHVKRSRHCEEPQATLQSSQLERFALLAMTAELR